MKYFLLFTLVSCGLCQEEDPETSALFKPIRIPIPVLNIKIRKPITFRKNVVTYHNKKNIQSYTTTKSPYHIKTYHPTPSYHRPSINTYTFRPYHPAPIDPTFTSSYPRVPTVYTPAVNVVPSGSQDIITLLAADERFTTLVAAVTAANISAATVEEIAPVTIFAPTNSAFAKIDNDTLTALLADQEALTQTLFRHIVPGKSVSLPDGTTQLDNAAGGQITINRSVDDIFSESVTIRTNSGSGKIVDFDIMASNGVVFAIDSVI